MAPIDLTSLDLSALLASRICHDIISPVGAITNGLEVLEEDGGEEMQAFAMELIHKSAKQASAKLQFARIAFGAAGSAKSEIDLGDGQDVAEKYFASEKADLSWSVPRVFLPKNQVKLLLNILLIANGTIPRGGLISIDMEMIEGQPYFKLRCHGKNARLSEGLQFLISGELVDGHIDAHSIQPFYTGLLARDSDMAIVMWQDEGDILIEISPFLKKNDISYVE